MKLTHSFIALLVFGIVQIGSVAAQQQAPQNFNIGQLPRTQAPRMNCSFSSQDGGMPTSVALNFDAVNGAYRLVIDGPMYCFEPNLNPNGGQPAQLGTFQIYMVPTTQGALQTPEQLAARNGMFWRCYEQALLYRSNPVKNGLDIVLSPVEYFLAPPSRNSVSIINFLDASQTIECKVTTVMPPL
jgi:hypothetical protein